MLDIKTLENWLWEAACKIRGPVDAPKYKDYILPLVFLKRLSDVFDEELDKLAEEYGNRKTAEELVEEDHSLVWFYLPKNARWSEIFKKSTNLGEFLTDAVRAVARENPKLQGVIDTRDYNETTAGQRVISDERLKALIDILNRHKIGLKDAEPDILGRAYEYLLRKFAEGSGQSAGEFYTPKEVAVLMAKIIEPKEGEEVYDPCLGSGGLIIKTFLRFKEKYGDDKKIKPLQFYGQEVLHGTYAMAKMNSFIHKMEANIALGDTMNKPYFLTKEGSLKQFDIVVANPMWNQDTFTQATYENDTYNRFIYGYPSNSSADWGWIQHMFKSLKKDGKMAVVLDTGAVSRGSGNEGSSRERDIRKQFVEGDLIEAVLLMPENLFYNTTSAGIILILNKNKKQKNKILLINASKLFEKRRPKNFLPDDSINKISDIFLNFKEEEGISKIAIKDELVKNDYNLSPSRYVSTNGEDTTLPLNEAVVLVKEAEEERKSSYEKLSNIFKQIDYEQNNSNQDYKNTELGELPRDWNVVKLKDLNLDISDGNYAAHYPKQSDFVKEGIPFIRANNIKNLRITWEDMKFISEKKHGELKKGHLKEKDILITTRGDLGNLAFVTKEFVDSNINAQIVRINTVDKVDPLFLLYFLSSRKIQEEIRGLKTGTTLAQLPVGKLKTLPILIPPYSEQKKIAYFLSIIQEAKEKNKIPALEELFKSMLHNLMTAKIRVKDLEI